MSPGLSLFPVLVSTPEDDMPNWWLIWAEHLATVLAEWWIRGRSAEADDPANGGDEQPPPDDDD